MEKKSTKLESILKSIIPSIILMLIQICASLFVMGFYFMKFINSNKFLSYDDFYKKLFKMVQEFSSLPYIYQLYSILGIILMLCLIKSKKDFRCNFNISALKGNMVIYLILLGISLQIFTSYVMNICIIFMPEEGKKYIELMENAGMTENIKLSMILYVAFLGPICEELAFRGLTMYYAQRGFSFWTANIIQSVLFGMFHMNVIQGIYAFVLGMAFGYVLNVTGGMLVPIVLHIIFNSTAGIMSLVTEFGNKNPITFCAFLTASMSVIYFTLIHLKKIGKNI